MYSEIKIHENIDSNYLWTSKGSMSDEEIDSFISSQTTKPNWTNDTILLSTFQQTLVASNPSILNNIVGYLIQRKDLLTGSIVNIGTFDGAATKIRDYSLGSSVDSKYYIVPIFEEEGKTFYGDPILSVPICPNYNGWSLIELLPGDKKNEYVVNEDNFWCFDLNVESDPYVLNSDKQFVDGFGRFSKTVSGDRVYVSGGISALIGHVDCKGEYFADNTMLIKKFYQFCHNATLKLLKDTKGNVLVVDVEPQAQIAIDGATIKKPSTVSFKFREVESIENIIVKGVVR